MTKVITAFEVVDLNNPQGHCPSALNLLDSNSPHSSL